LEKSLSWFEELWKLFQGPKLLFFMEEEKGNKRIFEENMARP